MVQINDIHVSYGQHHVLEGLNLTIPDSGIHGLVGLNGSGKTTLLNTLYGIKSMHKGSISFSVTGKSPQLIGYLETQNYFYPRITAMEYLKLISNRNPAFAISKWNELFELPLDQLIDEYSTGMKKKLAMFGVLSLDRPFLILDEPFNGIDLETVYKLKSLYLKLKEQGKTILITSHILESLIPICDQISYLNRGIIEFTLDKEYFNTLEQRIFSIHRQKIDHQLSSIFEQEKDSHPLR
jgi:ABC-2 type transport system ATP-binding protein